MHPILARRDLTIAYAILWLVLGAALAWSERLPGAAFGAIVPLVLVFGFICLTPSYCASASRCGPGRCGGRRSCTCWWRSSPPSLWVLLVARVLALLGGAPTGTRSFVIVESIIFARAVPVFLLSSVLHYLALAVRRSRVAETRSGAGAVAGGARPSCGRCGPR